MICKISNLHIFWTLTEQLFGIVLWAYTCLILLYEWQIYFERLHSPPIYIGFYKELFAVKDAKKILFCCKKIKNPAKRPL